MVESITTELQNYLGSDKVLTGDAVQERYHHIWRMNEPLRAKAVIIPQTTRDVATALKICNDYNQPVVPHGGLTNLVGSTETSSEEVVISMEKMNAIEEVDESSRTMTVQAGAILERVQLAAKEKNLLFPLNFGAKGSAQIGGAISTNAGGLRVVKFGMTRNLVLGLETVLADGTIISSLKKIIKDNSAYDLKQLFIGSEGTLGIITKAVLKLVEAPKSRVSAFIGLNHYDKVVELLKFMDSALAGTLSGFELMWQPTYMGLTSPPMIKPPLPYDYNYYVLMEALGGNDEPDQQRLLELLEEATKSGMIEDAVPAFSGSDLDWFWRIREEVDPIVDQCNHEQQFDISLPIGLIGAVVDGIVENLYTLKEIEKVFAFGHVADGNIHFIIGKNNDSKELIEKINEVVYSPLEEIGGSVSAEHGIGVHKKAYLHLSRNPEEIALMKTLKTSLDPKGILNPGKVLDI